jgi:DtxR family transcriptional regulator, Mn-dependent transcriptional regulator
LALAVGECKPVDAVPHDRNLERVAEMHDTTEEYLETILSIEEEGIVPLRARLVERLGLSAAAVSETVARLEDQGYVELAGDRRLNLTEKGRGLATTVVRRHRLAERLLVDVIGLEWEKVHAEAARWEHAISSDVEEKLVQLLGDPATCPHGNPIPGSHNPGSTLQTVSLSEVQPGPIVVVRVSERLEQSGDALALVADAQLMPGCDATVITRDADGVVVKTTTGEFRVPTRVAEFLYVSPR